MVFRTVVVVVPLRLAEFARHRIFSVEDGHSFLVVVVLLVLSEGVIVADARIIEEMKRVDHLVQKSERRRG